VTDTDLSSTGRWSQAGSGLTPWSSRGRWPAPTGPKMPCGCGVCPACTGLTSATRPRFFAGQLLTDAELIELQSYVIDKNKLHNRFLHGWGVVCGLEVVCGDCGDDIVVRPGYALDPCGNDVVVPSAQRFDIAAAIQACLTAERTSPICDPPYGEPPSRCDDEATWCVTLRYREQDVRPITPLAPSPARSCSCGGASCGCGGNGGGGRSGYECTCGAGGGHSATACGCSAPAGKTSPAPGCEPTRTIECFELGACRDEGRCHDFGDVIAGTMPQRIIECLLAVSGLFSDRISKDNQKVGARIALDVTKRGDADKAEAAVGQLYDAVVELYERDPLRTRCTYPKEFDEIVIVPQDEGESESAYLDRMSRNTQLLLVLVVNYLRDCICDALLPPCPPDPCDDRIILACVTMKDGKVVEVCNQACRRYAGSFVSREYWLPVGPVLTWLAGLLCCFPILGRGRYRGVDVGRLLRSYDPERSARQKLAENDFAAVSDVWSRAQQAVRRVRGSVRGDLVSRLIGDRVNLAAQLGKRPSTATRALAKQRVTASVVEVDDPDLIPARGVGPLPLVRPGSRVVAYVHENKVLGFGPAPDGDGG
jgi:hypothetical protein